MNPEGKPGSYLQTGYTGFTGFGSGQNHTGHLVIPIPVPLFPAFLVSLLIRLRVFARREFKRDLALVIHHEICGKRFPGLGDELVEQIGLVRSQQLLRLRRLNRLLQNFPVNLEPARFGIRLRLFAKIARLRVKDLSATLRTLAQRFLAGEINFRRRLLRPLAAPALPFASRGGNSKPTCHPC